MNISFIRGLFTAIALLLGVLQAAVAQGIYVCQGPNCPQIINGMTLSGNTFTGGSSSGTVIGSISVSMGPATPGFSGSLSISGPDAGSFQLAGANLETNGVIPAGTYHINIVATQAGAVSSPFSTAATIVGNVFVACAQGNAYVDGCLGAPVGLPQFPSILSSYATRPPWNVPGVDYHAGYPNNITLADPTNPANLPAGAAYSTGAGPPTFSRVTVTGCPVVLNGFDFSKGNGTEVIFASGACGTVQNSLLRLCLVGSTNCVGGTASSGAVNPGSCASGSNGPIGTGKIGCGTVVSQFTGAGAVSLLNNEIDGQNAYCTTQQGTLVDLSHTANTIGRYNYIHNGACDGVDQWGGGPAADTWQYNVWAFIGLQAPTAHSDSYQYFNSSVSSADLSFNLVYENSTGHGGMGNGLLMLGPSEGSSASLTNGLMHNNTIIATQACTDCNWITGFYTADALGGTASRVAIYDNYADASGVYFNGISTASAYLGLGKDKGSNQGAPTSSLASPMIMSQLIDMTNNAAISVGGIIPVPNSTAAGGPDTQFGFYVAPDQAGHFPALSDVYSITPSPVSGNLTNGQTITFTLAMATPWTVTGAPTASLNNGKTASFTSGSGTNSLVFTYTVGAEASTNIGITAFNLNGGTIKDGVGNSTTLSPLTNLTTVFSGLNTNQSGGGACPLGSSFADGCPAASAGTPQFPNLFSSPLGTPASSYPPQTGCTVTVNGHTNCRPPWNVAGVDYHVGPAAGTAFLDPTTHLPTGCTYNTSDGFATEITCNNPNGITYQNMDFGLHNGANVVLLGACVGPITFTNNTYLQGSTQNLPLVRNQCTTQTGQVICTYNFIDGGPSGTSSPYGGLLDEGCDVSEYNYLTRVPEDVFWPSPAPTIKYNLIYLEGYTSGGHPDGVQWQGESVSNPTVTFNTYINVNVGQPASSGVQPLHMLTQGGSSPGQYRMTNPVVSNNTMIFPLPTGNSNTIILCGGDANDLVTGFVAANNYIDSAGTSAFGANGTGCATSTYTNNINLATGAVIPHP